MNSFINIKLYIVEAAVAQWLWQRLLTSHMAGDELQTRDLHGNGDDGNTAVAADLPR